MSVSIIVLPINKYNHFGPLLHIHFSFKISHWLISLTRMHFSNPLALALPPSHSDFHVPTEAAAIHYSYYSWYTYCIFCAAIKRHSCHSLPRSFVECEHLKGVYCLNHLKHEPRHEPNCTMGAFQERIHSKWMCFAWSTIANIPVIICDLSLAFNEDSFQ